MRETWLRGSDSWKVQEPLTECKLQKDRVVGERADSAQRSRTVTNSRTVAERAVSKECKAMSEHNGLGAQ